MKKIAFALLATGSLMSSSACRKQENPAAAVARLEVFKAAMCRCADAACVTKVKADMATWSSKGQPLDAATATKVSELSAAIDACAKTSTGELAAAVAKMEEFKVAMCQCTDAACATKVTDAMNAWSMEVARTASTAMKLDEATTKKMTDLSIAMSDCAQKAMTPTETPPVAAVPPGAEASASDPAAMSMDQLCDKAIGMMTEMAGIVAVHQGDCDGMGDDLQTWTADNKAVLEFARAQDKDEAKKRLFDEACKPKLGPIMEKLGPMMTGAMECKDNAKVKQALDAMGS